MFKACEGGEDKGCQRQQNMVLMGFIFWAWCSRSWEKATQTWPSHNCLTSARPCSLWTITSLPFSQYGLSLSWPYIPISKSDYARKFKMSLTKITPQPATISCQIGKSFSTWFSSQKFSFKQHNLHFKFHKLLCFTQKHGIKINYTLCLCYLAWIVDGHGIKQNDATFNEISSKLNLFHDLCDQLQHNFIEI